MIKKVFYLLSYAVLVMLTFLAVNKAMAYENIIQGDTLIKGGLSVDGDLYANHNVLKFNPSGYSKVDPIISFMRGDSNIVEMGDLFVISDDYVHLGPSKYEIGKVLIQTPSEISSRSRSAHGALEAGTVKINNKLEFASGAIADFSNASVTGLVTPLSEDFLELAGGTMAGELVADGGLSIDGKFYLNTSGNLYSASPIETTNTLTVHSTSFLNGGINVSTGNFIMSPEGNLMAKGIVDFSGATLTRVSNSASAPTCNAQASGAIYFNTANTNFYGCNGIVWLKLNNDILPN